MKICDRCEKSEKEVDCDVSITTYMAMLTQMYSPHFEPKEDYRLQVELCDSCAGEVAEEISSVVRGLTGKEFCK